MGGRKEEEKDGERKGKKRTSERSHSSKSTTTPLVVAVDVVIVVFVVVVFWLPFSARRPVSLLAPLRGVNWSTFYIRSVMLRHPCVPVWARASVLCRCCQLCSDCPPSGDLVRTELSLLC